jgi:hypothetical protein
MKTGVQTIYNRFIEIVFRLLSREFAVMKRYKKIYRRYPKNFMNKTADDGVILYNNLEYYSKKLIYEFAHFLQLADYED